jgi:hypothetical protein
MHRWEEEVELTLEEMRRALCYMDWRANHWRTLASKGRFLDPTVQEGTAAYAKKQAFNAQGMALKFSQKWLPLLVGYSIIPDWPEHYTVTTYV